MEGIYNIWKPTGMSSFAVVRRMRKITGIKKIGHAGTLDPAAEGVLVVCVGRTYTKSVSELAITEKEYVVDMRLGVVTDTYDNEGTVLRHGETSGISEDEIRAVVARYHGEQQQLPPMFSAVHYQGKRLYELARKGIEVEREPRTIRVSSIAVENIDRSSTLDVTLRIVCSSGTYVRTLCHDIGNELGCGAIAAYIKRVRVGSYSEKDSLTLEQFEQAMLSQSAKR